MKQFYSLSEALSNEIQKCQNILHSIQEKRKSCDDENLYVRKHRGANYFYTVYKNPEGRPKERYISKKNDALIQRLSEGKYYRRLELVIQQELQELTEFQSTYKPELKTEVWENMPLESKILTEPLVFSNAQAIQRWKNEKFQTNTYAIANPGQFITKNGEDVRSKNELITANLLYDLGLAYRYECMLELKDGVLYPDFTVLHPANLEEWYIEFFGLMDDPQYEASCLERIQKYYREGLQPRLIMLFDSSASHISTRTIERVIRQNFLNN